jgi:hypothetical protein
MMHNRAVLEWYCREVHTAVALMSPESDVRHPAGAQGRRCIQKEIDRPNGSKSRTIHGSSQAAGQRAWRIHARLRRSHPGAKPLRELGNSFAMVVVPWAEETSAGADGRTGIDEGIMQNCAIGYYRCVLSPRPAPGRAYLKT